MRIRQKVEKFSYIESTYAIYVRVVLRCLSILGVIRKVDCSYRYQ